MIYTLRSRPDVNLPDELSASSARVLWAAWREARRRPGVAKPPPARPLKARAAAVQMVGESSCLPPDVPGEHMQGWKACWELFHALDSDIQVRAPASPAPGPHFRRLLDRASRLRAENIRGDRAAVIRTL